MAQASEELLGDLLKQVSRSFYLTLRVLAASIRSPIGLAYLLARTTDTIADTDLVALEQRLEALRQLRERIQGRGDTLLDFGALARRPSTLRTLPLSTTVCNSARSKVSAPIRSRAARNRCAASFCNCNCACNSADAATLAGIAALPSSHWPTALYVNCATLRTSAR